MTYRQPPTVNLCYYKHSLGEPCSEPIQWKITTEKGNIFKICDKHLAWSLRFSGLPARVDAFITKPNEEDISSEMDDTDEKTPVNKGR